MYGMINQAVKHLVVERFGANTWGKIRAAAGVEDDAFLAMEQYPDELTYRLVQVSSEILEIPATEVLEAFGAHWIEYTSEAGYGELLDGAGANLEECLHNLDQLHTRVRLGMPHLAPPSFEVENDGGGVFLLHYFSHREGLAHLVVGLVRGLAERLGEQIEIEQIESRANGDENDTFRISIAN